MVLGSWARVSIGRREKRTREVGQESQDKFVNEKAGASAKCSDKKEAPDRAGHSCHVGIECER